MGIKATKEKNSIFCRKLFTGLLWAQAVMGIFMLYNTLVPAAHAVLVVIAAVAVLVAKSLWEKPAARITARVLCGVPFLLAVTFLVQLVQMLVLQMPLLALAEYMCIIGGVVLCYFTVAAGTVSLRGGVYDKVVACFCCTWMAAITALISFTKAGENVLFTWEHLIVKVVWVVVTAAAAVLCWVCAFLKEEKA